MPDYFPAFLDLRGRRCLVVGGGLIAERKVYGLLECGARVTAVDRPAQCDFIYGAVLRRGELQIAVSTGGRAPALAREIRRRLEPVVGSEYEALVERVGRVRRLARATAAT